MHIHLDSQRLIKDSECLHNLSKTLLRMKRGLSSVVDVGACVSAPVGKLPMLHTSTPVGEVTCLHVVPLC